MRTDKDFVSNYTRALYDVDPGARDSPSEELRTLAAVEICLALVHQHAPGEDVASIPFLLLGYPALLGKFRTASAERAVATVRHLCGRFSSASAWIDACLTYSRSKETWRCHNLSASGVERRIAAPAKILRVLEQTLSGHVPWSQPSMRVAAPGEARIKVEHGRKVLVYDVPPVSAARQIVKRHDLRRRTSNPALTFEWAELVNAAQHVDDEESGIAWPSDSLPPLHLSARLTKIRIEGIVPGLWDSQRLTLNGATHVVGMLSSGKSTLVWAIIFALAFRNEGRRTALLVGDTIHGAAVGARLRRHGIKATVLSSVRNRERHFSAIQWRHGLTAEGRSLSTIGDLTDGFDTACTLDGFQRDPIVARGEDGRVTWPGMHEKPCHRLYQPGVRDNGEDESVGSDVVDGAGFSCPLFANCPAQQQQVSAVDAQVLIMTPQAFVHMTPDPWTSENRITMPELLQYTVDLVIMDEVDGIQKAFDDAFAPRSPIMGDERDVYAPTIGTRTSEALRARSGHQFRHAANVRWQSNFHTLFGLIGILYAILQREGDSIGRFYKHAPFTSAGILGELWHLRRGRRPGDEDPSHEAYEKAFVDVLRVSTAIGQFSRASAVADEQRAGDRDSIEDIIDVDLKDAAKALRELGRQVLTSDYYDDLLEGVERDLDRRLAPFDARDRPALRRGDQPLNARSNAAALLLAVVTELVLAHYNWLIKAQPGVAQEFDIDDGQLLSQAGNLLRHYRTLLPANPAGGVFGLFYDEPPAERRDQLGGKLTLVNHLGVGRHLVVHLHDLLAADGQAGPHVLMLSGTSWAGGTGKQFDGELKLAVDIASPMYDVQVRVAAVLAQPDDELQAIEKSRFGLFEMREENGAQMAVSGLRPPDRQRTLALIAQRFGAPRDAGNLLAQQWDRLEKQWGSLALQDRRRALLVVNSYADAAIVADALLQSLHVGRNATWNVYCLVPDRADDDHRGVNGPSLATPLPRSLVERFGKEDERSVLVAPLYVIARGHNILNRQSSPRAGISTIYFLHRPHPRPDDLAPAVARLNRLAVQYHDGERQKQQPILASGRTMRREAASLVRLALAMRGGYRALPSAYKAQFAWDMLTPVWQTIGRGIRGGCPVYAGFVDAQFAPQSFALAKDTENTSVLVQTMMQLHSAFNGTDISAEESMVAKRLYEPLYAALKNMEGLNYE